MRRLFSTFAHGAPGLGLLLLRLTTGSTLIYQAAAPLLRHAPFAAAAVPALLLLPGVLLLVGLWTPIAGALLAVAGLYEAVSQPPSQPAYMWIAIIAGALVLLGPGAWSVDARLYGWKQIKISDRRAPGQDSQASP